VKKSLKIAAFVSSYRGTRTPVGAAEGCDLLIFSYQTCGRYSPATHLAGFQKQQSSSQPTIKKHNVPGGI
jgi:hypothetical protein